MKYDKYKINILLIYKKYIKYIANILLTYCTNIVAVYYVAYFPVVTMIIVLHVLLELSCLFRFLARPVNLVGYDLNSSPL